MNEHWEVFSWNDDGTLLEHEYYQFDPRQGGWIPSENVEIAHIQGDKKTWLSE